MPQHQSRQDHQDRSSVLVADDDPIVRRLLVRALRRHGMTVCEAENGRSALELVESETLHLAIVDLRMPEVDGFEVVHQLKARFEAALPVIVLSGVADPDERVRAFEAGADDFVAKPVYMTEFLKRVDAFERTRRALREAREANERADRLRMFVAEAAALLAHDLNNGLSIASANLQFLEEELDMDGEQADAMGGSRRALRRMRTLVRNFVDISRLEDDAIDPQRVDVDIHDLLESVSLVHNNVRTAPANPIRVECPDRLVAEVDPVLLERILHNLLNNATRYVNSGGDVCVRAHVAERAAGGEELVVAVGNTGAAIPDSVRPHLFTKYRKGQDGKAQRGMGLYFCKLASEAHGGQITLEDDEHYVTYFVVRLPL